MNSTHQRKGRQPYEPPIISGSERWLSWIRKLRFLTLSVVFVIILQFMLGGQIGVIWKYYGDPSDLCYCEVYTFTGKYTVEAHPRGLFAVVKEPRMKMVSWIWERVKKLFYSFVALPPTVPSGLSVSSHHINYFSNNEALFRTRSDQTGV